MRKVLMVEDNPAEADTLKAHLHRYGSERGEQFSVTWLRSGIDSANDEHGFDLIFMDIDLPGFNGLETARSIRAWAPDTPLIFVTNLAQYAVRGYEVDAIDFMVKPVTYGSFRMRMDKAMRYVRRAAVNTLPVQVSRDETRILSLPDVEAVEVMGHHLTYHFGDGSDPLEIYGSLSKIEDRLVQAGFVMA